MNVAKWTEVTLVGLGVIATALIGFGQWNLGKQQNALAEKMAQDTMVRELAIAKQGADLQLIALVHPHLESFANCSASDASQRMVTVSSAYLTLTHKSTVIAEMAEQLAAGCGEGITQSTRTRVAEATTLVAVSEKEDVDWFAVIGTYAMSRAEDAKNEVPRLQKIVNDAGIDESIVVYRTKISNSFALVLSGPKSEAEAKELARTAQKIGLAHDAFAQIDREWIEQTL